MKRLGIFAIQKSFSLFTLKFLPHGKKNTFKTILASSGLVHGAFCYTVIRRQYGISMAGRVNETETMAGRYLMT